MKKWFVIAVITILIAGFTKLTTHHNDPEQIKNAINKSLPLLQSSSHTFLLNAGGCHSCHGQGIGGVAFSLAKEKGFVIQDTILQEVLDSVNGNWTQRKHYFAQNEDPAAIIISGGYDLWTFAANHTPANKTLGLLAKNMMQRQLKNGSWVAPNARPPIEYYAFSATAMTVKGIQAYLPTIFKNEAAQRITSAKNWMMNTKPIANEEKIFQLLGLHWCNGDKNFMKQQAAKLIAAQHTDGGWSQLDSLPSDAYATGQSLYALYQAGLLSIDAPAYQKGIVFLLNTQLPDGSWQVQTRSFPSVDYVYSGFPHGDNQFISAAGSTWATMALLLATK
jgi:N-acyl-D-amino-acid deacylase